MSETIYDRTEDLHILGSHMAKKLILYLSIASMDDETLKKFVDHVRGHHNKLVSDFGYQFDGKRFSSLLVGNDEDAFSVYIESLDDKERISLSRIIISELEKFLVNPGRI